LSDTNSIETVSFVGSGNVATHLALALFKAGIGIKSVFSPNKLNADEFAEKFKCQVVSDITETAKSIDMLILAIPDSRVAEVCNSIPDNGTLVVHTSGINAMEALKSKSRYGVFYPLQTFSKERELDMKTVPFCLEANNNNDLQRMYELAKKISSNVHFVNSKKRKLLHLTAVMVSNFSNHLYHLSYDILESGGVSFDFLKPLIQETASKVEEIHPHKAQTGPARRNDITTLEEHMKMLSQFPEYQQVYKLLSEQIRKKFHE